MKWLDRTSFDLLRPTARGGSGQWGLLPTLSTIAFQLREILCAAAGAAN